MLTSAQLKARDGKLTASKVGILMGSDPEPIHDLWRELTGDPTWKPKDLSGVWPVQLGLVTEQLQLDWYERKSGHQVTNRGVIRTGDPEGYPDWMACTLDGLAEDDEGYFFPIECKHVGGREPLETIVARYQAQCHWQMMCTGARKCALSVIMGANEPIVEYIQFDEEYAKELVVRAEAFMLCVATLTPPVALPAVEPPVIPAKEYDFNGNPDWQLLANRWVQSYGAAQTAKDCEKAIKELVPQDAKKAFGAGIVVTRNRAGSMSLRELR